MSRSKFGLGDLSFAGQRVCSRSSAGASLRAFEICPPVSTPGVDSGWRLWTCCDLAGTPICESVIVDDIFQFSTYIKPLHTYHLLHEWQMANPLETINHMDAAYFDNLVRLDPPEPTLPLEHPDIPEIFLQHLFYPGRFSALSLQTVLDDYIANRQDPEIIVELDVAYPALSLKFAAVIGSNIQMEINQQTGAPAVDIYRRDLKLEWLGVWARVRELEKHGQWPIGSAILGDQIFIVCRGGVMGAAAQDTCEVISSTKLEDTDDLKDLSVSSIVTYPLLQDPESRAQILAISCAGESLSSALAQQATDDGTMSSLDSLIENINEAIAAPAQTPIEALAAGIWDEAVEPYLTEEDYMTARRILSDCVDLSTGLSSTLDCLCDFTSPVRGAGPTVVQPSGLLNALTASALSRSIASRYTLARGLLLVCSFCLVESDASAETEEGEALIGILARTLAVYHRYRVLWWLSQQTGEEARQYRKAKPTTKRRAEGQDVLAEGMGSLRVAEASGGDDLDGYSVEDSLLHSLLAHPPSGDLEVAATTSATSAATSFLSSTGIITPDLQDDESLPADVKLACTILVDNHPTAAKEYTELFPSSSGLAYVKGRACLELGEADEAARLLRIASTGCEDAALRGILPTTGEVAPLTRYFIHVTNLFEELGLDAAVAHFGNLALDSAHGAVQEMREIRTKVFLANLSLGAYKEAYSLMVGTSNLEL